MKRRSIDEGRTQHCENLPSVCQAERINSAVPVPSERTDKSQGMERAVLSCLLFIFHKAGVCGRGHRHRARVHIAFLF